MQARSIRGVNELAGKRRGDAFVGAVYDCARFRNMPTVRGHRPRLQQTIDRSIHQVCYCPVPGNPESQTRPLPENATAPRLNKDRLHRHLQSRLGDQTLTHAGFHRFRECAQTGWCRSNFKVPFLTSTTRLFAPKFVPKRSAPELECGSPNPDFPRVVSNLASMSPIRQAGITRSRRTEVQSPE